MPPFSIMMWSASDKNGGEDYQGHGGDGADQVEVEGTGLALAHRPGARCCHREGGSSVRPGSRPRRRRCAASSPAGLRRKDREPGPLVSGCLVSRCLVSRCLVPRCLISGGRPVGLVSRSGLPAQVLELEAVQCQWGRRGSQLGGSQGSGALSWTALAADRPAHTTRSAGGLGGRFLSRLQRDEHRLWPGR